MKSSNSKLCEISKLQVLQISIYALLTCSHYVFLGFVSPCRSGLIAFAYTKFRIINEQISLYENLELKIATRTLIIINKMTTWQYRIHHTYIKSHFARTNASECGSMWKSNQQTELQNERHKSENSNNEKKNYNNKVDCCFWIHECWTSLACCGWVAQRKFNLKYEHKIVHFRNICYPLWLPP